MVGNRNLSFARRSIREFEKTDSVVNKTSLIECKTLRLADNITRVTRHTEQEINSVTVPTTTGYFQKLPVTNNGNGFTTSLIKLRIMLVATCAPCHAVSTRGQPS